MLGIATGCGTASKARRAEKEAEKTVDPVEEQLPVQEENPTQKADTVIVKPVQDPPIRLMYGVPPVPYQKIEKE